MGLFQPHERHRDGNGQAYLKADVPHPRRFRRKGKARSRALRFERADEGRRRLARASRFSIPP